MFKRKKIDKRAKQIHSYDSIVNQNEFQHEDGGANCVSCWVGNTCGTDGCTKYFIFEQATNKQLYAQFSK